MNDDHMTLPFLAHSLGGENIRIADMACLEDLATAINNGYDRFAEQHHADIDTSFCYEVVPTMAEKMTKIRQATEAWPTREFVEKATFTTLYELEFGR